MFIMIMICLPAPYKRARLSGKQQTMSFHGNHSVTIPSPHLCYNGYPDFDRSTSDHAPEAVLEGRPVVLPNQLDWISPAIGFCTQELLDEVLYGYSAICDDDAFSPNGDRKASADQSKQLSHGTLSDRLVKIHNRRK